MAHFCIAGAGIAGLTTAIALGRDGHKVDVVERRAVLDEVGAGIQLAPNATRAAQSLGLLEALQDVAVELQAVRMRRGSDGRAIATVPLGDAARARYGAPFLLVHRADLQHVLLGAATALGGVEVSLSTTLVCSEPASGATTLEAPAGTTTVKFDGIVRADGIHIQVPDRRGSKPRPSGKTAWRALVPAMALPPRFQAPCSNLWLAPNAHVVHYPLRGGSLINVVVVVEEGAIGRADRDIWAEPGDPDWLRRRLAGWHADVMCILDAAPGWRKWPLFDGNAARWSTDRETTVGDAAHPMLPFLAQGASQALEDAAALRSALAFSEADVPTAFRLFEQRRAPHARRVQEASRRQGRIYHMGGLAASARDASLRLLGPDRLLARLDWVYGPPAR